MKVLRVLCLSCLILCAPALARGRYSTPYEREVRPLLQLPPEAPWSQERPALERLLATQELTAAQRYSAERHLLFKIEFEDRQAFHALRQRIQPEPDDPMLQTTLAIYEGPQNYLPLIEKIESLFDMALQLEPATEVAGWIARDAMSLITENYDFARASHLMHRAIASLPEESWLLRSHLLATIARLYVDPGNSAATVQQGLAIYADNEKRLRSAGHIEEANDSAYNQGIGVLFAFDDARSALKHFSRVSGQSLYWQDSLVFSALAHARLGELSAARERLRQVNFQNYRESSLRVAFLRCYAEIVRHRLREPADLELCLHLSEGTQLDVIQHMTSEILQLPLTPAVELAALRQFQKFYQEKIVPQNKRRMAQSVDGLELARARAESDRSRFESKISRIELDLAHKQSQLTAFIALSLVILLALLSFGLWRRQVQRHRLLALQQYLQTRILSRFLPPALVEEIRLGRSRLDEEPQKRVVTILYADLVDFTAKAEVLGSERTARLLNQWMHKATEVVFAENGTIDKFMGDCVMVIFGAPLEIAPEIQMQRAAACARRLMETMEELNRDWEEAYDLHFQLRVGINHGEAIVGSFGSEKRSDYTVIGGAVNLASRIENMAEPGQILMSESAARLVAGVHVQRLGPRSIRGMQGTQELFELHWRDLRSVS